MSSPDLDEYWRKVERTWSDSVAAANGGIADRSFTTQRVRRPWGRSIGPVVVTGMSGAGKTVVSGMLQGLIDSRYKKTDQSEDTERRKVKIASGGNSVRARVYVLPGDPYSRERQRWVGRLFKRGIYPAGVVHVVDWGMAEMWDPGGRQEVLNTLHGQDRQTNLTSVRDEIRANLELADFRRTTNLLRSAWADKGDEVWLIIAVTKCDLYWPQISDVGKYYVPGADPAADTDFTQLTRALLEQVQYPKFAVHPISCASDPFGFSEGVYAASGSFNDNWRAALISRMLKTIGEFNGFQ
ncbi:MAG TPA: hypothetical protein VF838_18260 [Trebonia sp.]